MMQIVKKFLLIFMLCMGCAYADDYTIDKRQYVSKAQWATVPYRHVLAVRYAGRGVRGNFCTANMVGGKIVTAKHCLYDDYGLDEFAKHVRFVAWNGTEIQVKDIVAGAYDRETDTVFAGDWAVLTPKEEFQDFVMKNSTVIENVASVKGRPVVQIGFGGLKILSDQEIDAFHKAYVKFLRDNEDKLGKQDVEAAIDKANRRGIDLETQFGYLFMDARQRYGIDVDGTWFADMSRLKLSRCKMGGYFGVYQDYKDTFEDTMCQSWGGDSGGGIFVDWDTVGPVRTGYVPIVAVMTRGSRQIGGWQHAGVMNNASVPLSPMSHIVNDKDWYGTLNIRWSKVSEVGDEQQIK